MIVFMHTGHFYAIAQQKVFVSDSVLQQIIAPGANSLSNDDTIILRADLKIEKEFKDDYRQSIFDYHREDEFKQKQKSKQSKSPSLNLDWLDGFVQVILVVTLAFMLVFLGYFLVLILDKRKKPFWVRKTHTNELNAELNAEQDVEEIDSINFKDRIESLRGTKVWRPIVRLYYLWVLQKMQDKGLVTYSRDKTDTAYLSDLEEGYFKEEFNEVLQIYFRVWYGQQILSQLQFEIVEERFKNVLNELD